jgi:hypothetical protein
MSRDHDRSVGAAVFDDGGLLTTLARDSIAHWLDRDDIDPAGTRQKPARLVPALDPRTSHRARSTRPKENR